MNRPALAPALALAFLLPAIPATAQDIPSPYRYMEKGQEVSVFAGYLDTDPGRFGFGPGPQQMYGARYSVVVANALSLEGLAGGTFGPRDVVNPARAEGSRVVEEAEVRLFLMEARLQFALTGRRTWHGIHPFVFAGGGLSFDTLGDQDEDFLLEEADRYEFGTRFTGTFGAGARFTVTDRILLRVDAGLLLYKLGYPAGWRDPDRGFEGVPEDEWMTGRGLTVGLAYRF